MNKSIETESIVDSYTGETIEELRGYHGGGKSGRSCGVQDHIKDAATQAVDALDTSWDLGYYGLPGMKPLLLLGELKDVAECGYELKEGPDKGDGPTWKFKKLPKKEWDMESLPTPEAFEKRCSEIMQELRLYSCRVA